MDRGQVLEWIAVRSKRLTGRRLIDSIRNTLYCPLTVACGVGVDSIAMLIEMKNRGIVPDLIVFSDTGSEKKATYEYVPILQAWLRQNGFPALVVVRRKKSKSGYTSLHGECLTNGTLPAISVGMKSCSIKWKIEPFNQYMNSWAPAANCWGQGGKVVKAIGFDAGPTDGRRILDQDGNPRLEDDKYVYWYPLVDWGYDREDCKQIIRDADLPVPVKSACFCCGSMREHEIDTLERDEPELLALALQIERQARPRLKRRPRCGLSRRFSWEQYIRLRDRQASFLDATGHAGRLPLTLTAPVQETVCPGG